jgi:ribosomal protein S18 acetylase RimI-like enzyme
MIHYPYRGITDQAEMLAVAQLGKGQNLHVIDLPYRFSSWAFDDPANIALWRGKDGALLAWVLLNTPFWSIDFAMHPAVDHSALKTILDWVDERAYASLSTPSSRPSWYVSLFEEQEERATLFSQFGYANQSDPAQVPEGDDPWSKVFLQYPVDLPLPAPKPLPAGFSLRPLAGQAEVEAYVDLHRSVFGSENMTVGWRTSTLYQPAYRPELDMVIEAPDGRLAGFCIGWFSECGPCGFLSGQIEPMGVHEDYRGLGLGAALLTETLRRLVAVGAQQLFVETDNDRGPALALYRSAGFEMIRHVHVYRKDC